MTDEQTKRGRGSWVYLLTVLLSLAYFGWRIFVKSASAGGFLMTTYLLYAALSLGLWLVPGFVAPLQNRLGQWLLLGLVLVYSLLFFAVVRVDGLFVAVVKDDLTHDSIVYWQDGEPTTYPKNELKPGDEYKNIAMAENLHKYGVDQYLELYKPGTATRNIYKAHPPLFFVISSKVSYGWHHLTGMYQPVAMRLFVFLLNLLNVGLVYLIYRTLLGNGKDASYLALIYFCLPYFFYYFACRAQNDQLIAFFTLSFFWANVRLLNNKSTTLNLLFGSLALAAAFWSKYTALLGLVAIGFFYLFYNPCNLQLYKRIGFVTLQALIGFAALGLWILILRDTTVGELQYDHWIGRMLNKVTDVGQIGKAKSGGRGGIGTMLKYFPFDIGIPQLVLLCLGLATFAVHEKLQWISLALLGFLAIYFAAAFLVIPKLNYTLPAIHALAYLMWMGSKAFANDKRFATLMLLQCILTFGLKTLIWAIEA